MWLNPPWGTCQNLQYANKTKLHDAVHPHMLRHACGFPFADQGADTRLIQDYLGHRNIQHTVRSTATNPDSRLGIGPYSLSRLSFGRPLIACFSALHQSFTHLLRCVVLSCPPCPIHV